MLRRPNRPARAWIGLLPALVLLAGCADLPGPTRAGFSPYMVGPEATALQRSIVVLPPDLEDRRLAVWREVDKTLLIERVVLANDTATRGENVVRVRTRHRGMPYFRVFSGPLRNPFTPDAVAQAVKAEFEGFHKITLPIDRVNQHGPYRYITAAEDDTTCVFAWQMIDDVAEITGNVNTYAVDFRFCARGDDPDRLVGLFDGLRLQPYL
jgi:hypothetical protein